MTLENFIWFCERDQIQNAVTVLRSGTMKLDTQTEMFGYIFTSPIQVALKYKNVQLIEESLDIYLNRLSLAQLKRALAFAKGQNLSGELLDSVKRASFKIQERISNIIINE